MDLGHAVGGDHRELLASPADIGRLLAGLLHLVEREHVLGGQAVALEALLDDVVDLLVEHLHDCLLLPAADSPAPLAPPAD